VALDGTIRSTAAGRARDTIVDEASALRVRRRPALVEQLSNARRHASDAPVHPAVRTVGEDVEVSVTDNGPGIDPAVGARSSSSPGEGVGLATARLLAEKLGGHLRIDRRPGLPGARFVRSLAVAVPATQDVRS
jgi:signal transduction histidine kinase